MLDHSGGLMKNVNSEEDSTGRTVNPQSQAHPPVLLILSTANYTSKKTGPTYSSSLQKLTKSTRMQHANRQTSKQIISNGNVRSS